MRSRRRLCGSERWQLHHAAKMRPMTLPSPQMRTLSLALKASGGEAPLARALGVSAEALSSWLAGRDALPASVYLRARKLVTTGR